MHRPPYPSPIHLPSISQVWERPDPVWKPSSSPPPSSPPLDPRLARAARRTSPSQPDGAQQDGETSLADGATGTGAGAGASAGRRDPIVWVLDALTGMMRAWESGVRKASAHRPIWERAGGAEAATGAASGAEAKPASSEGVTRLEGARGGVPSVAAPVPAPVPAAAGKVSESFMRPTKAEVCHLPPSPAHLSLCACGSVHAPNQGGGK